MSDRYYHVRLRWDGGAGIAKAGGVERRLTAPPDLGAGPVHALRYSPQIGERIIQRSADAPPFQTMTDDEVRAADRLLRALKAKTPP